MNDRIHVLMIEDEEDDYLIARKILAGAGHRFELTWRATLREGLASIGLYTDAVLLDLSLPDSQGWETFVTVRTKAPHIPIILLTGLDDEQLGVRAVHEGAQDYLIKGELEVRLLSRAILYAIERKSIEERLEHMADELGVANTRMAEDLRMAHDVQRALMPRSFPSFPPWTVEPEGGALRFGSLFHPCKSVGGDFYDVFAVTDETVGILLCDVVGHGVRSALVTALVRGFMGQLRPLASNPGRLLTELNRMLISVLKMPGQLLFASAICVWIDARTGHMRAARAGHPAPLIVRPGAGAAWMEFPGTASGPALGIDVQREFGVAQAELAEGDRLVLFTDGVYEAQRNDGQEYGRDRLRATVCAESGIEKLPEVVMRDVENFVSNAELTDDVCLLCMERKSWPVGMTR